MRPLRWRPDPLRVVIATAVLFLLGVITMVALADPVVDLEEAELAAAAAAARAQARAANQAELDAKPATTTAEPVLAKPAPRTKKGKLMQQRLAEQRARLALAEARQGRRPKVSLRAGGTDAALVVRVLKKRLAASFVDESDAQFALTLRVDRKPGAGVTLKCSVAVAVMPQRNLVASFASQAGVEGEVSDAELLGDAAEACATALAEDLGPWLQKGR